MFRTPVKNLLPPSSPHLPVSGEPGNWRLLLHVGVLEPFTLQSRSIWGCQRPFFLFCSFFPVGGGGGDLGAHTARVPGMKGSYRDPPSGRAVGSRHLGMVRVRKQLPSSSPVIFVAANKH